MPIWKVKFCKIQPEKLLQSVTRIYSYIEGASLINIWNGEKFLGNFHHHIKKNTENKKKSVKNTENVLTSIVERMTYLEKKNTLWQ